MDAEQLLVSNYLDLEKDDLLQLRNSKSMESAMSRSDANQHIEAKKTRRQKCGGRKSSMTRKRDYLSSIGESNSNLNLNQVNNYDQKEDNDIILRITGSINYAILLHKVES